MQIDSELDVLLIAVRQLLKHDSDIANRKEILCEELQFLEATGEENSRIALVLKERLSLLAIRGGILHESQLREEDGLEVVETLVAEGMSRLSDSSLPDNVVMLKDYGVLPISKELKDEEESGSLQSSVRDVLNSLTKKEATAIRLIFGIDTEEGKNLVGSQTYTQKYAAEKLGVNQTMMSRMYRKAIQKLRHPTRLDHLRPFAVTMNSETILTREQNLLLVLFGTPNYR